MKILFHLNHPAHYHLFKNVFTQLKENGHSLLVTSKTKDVLDELLIKDRIPYINLLPNERGLSKLAMMSSVLIKLSKLIKVVQQHKPDILVGTAFELAHIGKLLNIPFISVNEDDANIIPLWSKYSYPWATHLLSPIVCDNNKWNAKTIKYEGYHELAYLHPDNFQPDINVADRYLNTNKPYAIIRFAQLTAHHDLGISGIDKNIALKLINLLKPKLEIFITSERKLESEFEQFRLNIDPIDIHHVLAYATMYIGDSQTMAAEAAVLGIPSIRFNGFVGKIGYLEELEHTYKLSYGVKTSEPDKLFDIINELLNMQHLKKLWQKRRRIMLNNKINVANFIGWFIGNYPNSASTIKTNPEYQLKFK